MTETVESTILIAADDHPVWLAWSRVGGRWPLSDRIEVVKDEKKSSIYRLHPLSETGRAVIAKRAAAGGIETEAMIYRDVLSELPVSSPHIHGTVPDDDPDFAWLFLEDAGSERLDRNNPEHCDLLARWLGTMNAAASTSRSARSLQSRNADWYLEQLETGRERVHRGSANPIFEAPHQEVLAAILKQYETVEDRWAELTAFCSDFPETLVHGDVAPKNIVIRREKIPPELFLLDWETAGWATPAVDLSYDVDRGIYYSAVRATWPGISLEQWNRLGQYGRVFRILSAIEWAGHDLEYAWADKPMRYLSDYNKRLSDALAALGWKSTP